MHNTSKTLENNFQRLKKKDKVKVFNISIIVIIILFFTFVSTALKTQSAANASKGTISGDEVKICRVG